MKTSAGYHSIWVEVCRRGTTCLLVWLILLCACFWQREILLLGLKYPLSRFEDAMPPLVTLSVVDSMYIAFELAFNASIFLVSPLAIYHIWSFTAPALRVTERRWIRMFVGLATFMFLIGIFVGWLVLLPLLFSYGRFFVPNDVMWMIDLRQYVHLFWSVGLYGGIVFQLPLLISLLARVGWLTSEYIHRCRGYVFFGCFVVGMLATPPDMFAQIIFAVPLYLLFELGWLCRGLLGSPSSQQAELVSLLDE